MKKNEFINGIKDGVPICLGYFSVSMAFGISAVMSGLPAWSAVLISLTNLTSAGQFAGVNIMISAGRLIELALTTLIINMRYFLMSLSVSQKIDGKMTIAQRFAISFGITDEIFAVSMRHNRPLTFMYMAGLILTPLIGWTGGSAVGAFATSVMPPILSSSMGIALYGMFIAIIIPPARDSRRVLTAVVMAVVSSALFAFLPVLNTLSAGWTIIIITVLGSGICATLFPVTEHEEGGDAS